MEPGLHRYVQRRGWDIATDAYEQYWQQQLQPALALVLNTAALQPGEDVIDVACGTGLATLPAAASVAPDGQVLGTDMSPRMVEGLGRCVAARGITNVEVACRDAEQLDTDRTFDVALCSLGLMYVVDPFAALRQLYRVVRPGGRTVVSVWGERRNCGWAGVFPVVEARVTSDVCPLFFALGAPGALTDTFTQAGFVDVVETRLEVGMEYAGDEEALGAAFRGGPVALAHSRFDEATRQSAYTDYLDSIAGFANGAGYRIPGEFVIASARRP